MTIPTDELTADISKLSLQHGSQNTVNCKGFVHSNVSHFPSVPCKFFQESREIGTFTRMVSSGKYLFDDKLGLRPLKDDICEYIHNPAKNASKIKTQYLGYDLLNGFEDYIPLSEDELNSMDGILNFIGNWEEKNGKKYGLENKFTIVSNRHHLIDLIMCPFSPEEANLIVTYLDGLLIISSDKSKPKEDSGIRSKDTRVRKLCYTGFELENLVTKGKVDSPGMHTCFYSIVENKLTEDVSLLLQAEMDSYNPKTDNYVELKCSVNFQLKNSNHRRKLLRMWIQTGLVPRTDLLVGFRDPYYNQLDALKPYTRDEIYKKFSTRNLNGNRKYYNFNSTIAVQWSHHVIAKITELVDKNLTDEPLQSFKLTLTRDLQLSLTKLANTPAGLIPEKFLNSRLAAK